MAGVPSVDEIRRKYANEIAAQKAEVQRLRDEAAQAQQRRDIACNKHILDTIANDMKNAQSFSSIPYLWQFDSEKCNPEPSINILKQKGFSIEYDIIPAHRGMNTEPVKGSTFWVRFNKY